MSGLTVKFCTAAMSIVSALMLGSCAAPTARQGANKGGVDWEAVVDMGQARYTLKPEQAATAVAPIDHASPIYPPELLERALPPRDIRVKVIVSATGEVTEVRSGNVDSVKDHDSIVLFDAVVAAVGAWRYNPLLLTDWVDGPDGSTHRVAAKAVPFSMDYIFHFEVKRGTPQVGVRKADST